MSRTIFAAVAILCVATASAGFAADAIPGASFDDYSRYSSIEGPRARAAHAELCAQP